jgi:hypothetical protein
MKTPPRIFIRKTYTQNGYWLDLVSLVKSADHPDVIPLTFVANACKDTPDDVLKGITSLQIIEVYPQWDSEE